MKKFSMMLAIAVASCLWTPQANAETYRMRYVHGNSASVNPMSAQRAKSGPERAIVLPSRETVGKFSVAWKAPDSGSFDPTVKATVKRAMQKWSERLETSKQIRITVYYEPMASDLFTECYVTYEKQADNSCKPSALAWSQAVGARPITGEDAEIVINSTAQWDFSTETQPGKALMHLETLVLRCIAQTLGYGTTFLYDRGGVIPGKDQFFTNLCGDNVFGPYEKLIFERYGTRLMDLDVTSKEFEEFVQPDDMYPLSVLYSDDAHRIYAPKSYEDTRSLGLSRNPNSLMWCEMEKGDRFFTIDDVTSEILKEIGWSINDKKDFNVQIRQGISTSGSCTNTGMLSAYGQYTIVFANNGLGSIREPRLRLNLFDKNGKREPVKINGEDTVINRNRLTFDLGDCVAVKYSDQKYRMTPGGELEAEFVWDYKLDGVAAPAKIFRLALDARPVVKSITRTRGYRSGNYFTATFSLEGEHIKDASCEITHPDGNVTRQYLVGEKVTNADDSYYYIYRVKNLSATGKSQFRINAVNEYGSSNVKQWWFDPSDPTANSAPIGPTIDRTSYYCIYDISGHIVFYGVDSEYEEARKSLKPGYYFIEHISEEGTVISTEKIKILK